MYAAVDNRGVSLCFKNAYVWTAKWHNKKAFALLLRDHKRTKLAGLSWWNTSLLNKPLFVTCTLHHCEMVSFAYPSLLSSCGKSPQK